jgi:virginiamycin B lyase
MVKRMTRRLCTPVVLGLLTAQCSGDRNALPEEPEGALAPSITEYLIPRPGNFPHDPAVSASGIVWYTDQANSFIGRLDPTTGSITDIPTPTARSGPHGIDVGPDDMVWYTGQAAGIIGRLDPRTNTITEYRLPPVVRNPHTPIVVGSKIWFTDTNNNSYGELDAATGQVRTFLAPTPNSQPYGIRYAADGFIWIALLGTNKLGRVDPMTGAMREFVLPTGARPRRLQVAADGFIWYTDFQRGYLGRLDPQTGAVREWRSPGGGPGPYGIAIGTDGRIWYNEAATSRMVGFDPRTEQMLQVTLPTPGAVVRHMATDVTRQRIWLALSGTGRLGMLDISAR